MGERRRRKSLWDQEDETTKNVSGVNEHNSFPDEHNSLSGKDWHSHHEFSASETFAEVKSEEPSWKSTEEIPVAPMHGNFNSKQNAPEGKEMGGGSTDYQNVPPGFDGTEQHKYNQDLGNGRNDSRRHMERGRSRSRSRSRTRGRSRSRSLSRGRRRGWSRSRSRSSSRSDGSARGKNRSRSPIGDYRRQPYGWGDKRGAPDKSSQVCREFAAGKCRRGSQCRFLHPKSVHSGNSDPLGDNTGKTCKDFIKGKCRWGDTCRFSHHSGSDGNSQKSTRYTSFNKGIDLQRDKNGKKPAGHSSGNENKSWGIPEYQVNSAKLVTPDGGVKQGELKVQEDFSIKAQQQPQNNLATSFASNVLNEVENSRDDTQSSLILGQHSNQNGENLFPGHSSTLNETGNWQNQQNQLYHNPTNAFSGNFNGPEVHQLEKPKISGFVSNPLTNEHSAQPTSSTVPSMFPNQTFMNKEPLKNEGPFSMDPTLPLLLVEAANNLQFNQDGVSHEPNGLVASAPAINEDGNHTEQGNDGNEPGNSGALDRHGKVEEKSGTKDDKTMRIFKNSLIEFVKDLLKPTWKEGKMSREVHKTIVKKVVEKVTSTIQADHIPRTQEKVDQYLSYSKPKIAKLVQAYVERCLKADAKS